ncbi:hypothetical protein ACFSKM_17430 [Ancylobacter dichloromethanicus]
MPSRSASVLSFTRVPPVSSPVPIMRSISRWISGTKEAVRGVRAGFAARRSMTPSGAEKSPIVNNAPK